MSSNIDNVVLEHTAGASAGERFPLRDALGGSPESAITFGRDPDCDVRFDADADRRASARHAELRVEDGVLVLQDLGSSNGTFVNGRSITRQVVGVGDRIRFGDGGPEILVTSGRRVDPTLLAEPRVARTEVIAAPVEEPPRPRPEPVEVPTGTAVTVGEGPGRRTVMLMIQQAVQTARRNPGTEFFQLVVSQATGESRRTTRKYAAALVVLVGVVAGGLLAKSGYDQRLLKAEMLDHVGGVEKVLVSQLASTNSSILAMETEMAELEANAATRTELEEMGALVEVEKERASRLQQQLEQTRAQVSDLNVRTVEALRSFRDAAASVDRALYMLAVHYPDLGRVQPFCSSFAVRADGLLYTNAHCNEAYDELLGEARSTNVRAIPVAVQNGNPDAIFEVIDRGSHPAYSSRDVDLAYLRIRAGSGLPQVIAIASPEELEMVGPGYDIAVFGYPGELMNSEPTASFLTGTVGRITEQNTFIQHSALTSGGTSGSPILNRRGEAVGINHAGLMHSLLTVATDSRGNVVLDRNGSPRMRRVQFPNSGRSYGIHGRFLAEWLETLN